MFVSRIFISCQNTCSLRRIPVIIFRSLRAPLQMAFFLLRIPCLGTYLWVSSRPAVVGGGGLYCARKARCAKLLRGVYLNGWGCAGVCETILAWDIYCAKPNPKSQSRYRVCKGLGTRAMRIAREYDLVTAIVIQPLTQPLTCEVGSSIFASMSWLKLASTTWYSLPIIPSTKMTKGEFSSVGCGSAARAFPS